MEVLGFICEIIIIVAIVNHFRKKKAQKQENLNQQTNAQTSIPEETLPQNNSQESICAKSNELEEDDEYELFSEETFEGKTYAFFMKREVAQAVRNGTGQWTLDDVILKRVRVMENGTKKYIPMANREILYKIVDSWDDEPLEDDNSVLYDSSAETEEIYDDYESETYYINNNSASLSNMVGGLKIYDKDGDVVGKVSHNPLLDRYTMRNGIGECIFRMDCDMHHKFLLCLEEDGNEVVMEFAKQGNFDVGFGLGHFVAVPLLSLPFGSFYGVSRRGNIYLQKDGKSKNVYLDNTIIARITHKTGFVAYAANSKSSVEMFTDDAELQAYVFAIFVCMHALN